MSVHICGTESCEQRSTHNVYWPGREPMTMCEEHTAWAKTVAEAMSFHLHVQRFPPPAASPNDEAAEGHAPDGYSDCGLDDDG